MKTRRKKSIRNILMLCFLTLFCISAWQVYSIKQDYKAGSDSYSSLAEYVSFGEVESTVSLNTPLETTEPSIKMPQITEIKETLAIDETTWPEIDFDSLCAINPDIVAWIYIEDTNINYPIVQGSDNDYYLTHLFDGTYNSSGCLFLDAYSESDFTEMNNIVYGHHMKNGSMFYDLKNYKQQDFYDNSPVGLLVTPTNRYKIVFFSGYVCNTKASAWNIEFSQSTYQQWLNELISKSLFSAPIIPTVDDYVVTLSTCSYEFNNARFVLHGILQEQ